MFFNLKLIKAVFMQYPFVSTYSTVFLGSVCIVIPLFLRIARYFFSSPTREYTPKHHQKKDNTPTMGGIIIGLVLGALMWLLSLTTAESMLLLLCYLLFACIGTYDDVCKIYKKRGISARSKFFAQIASAFVVVIIWFIMLQPDTLCVIPFVNYTLFDWGYFLIPWSIFVIVACSNAVNITDGLDGLATIVALPGIACTSGIAFFLGYDTIVLFSLSMCISLLAFLPFNWYPAQLFMGDVGSLSLGAVWACILLIMRQELLWPLTALVCMFEIVSVVIQVIYFKLYRTRLFLMAPLHHHFELRGWHETQITICAGILSVLSCVLVYYLYVYA